MADQYYVITSYRSIQVMSPTTILDCEYVTCATTPHGFKFAYAVPLDSWIKGDGTALLEVIASQLEALAANGEAIASQPIQEVDANGLLSDSVEVVVQYDRTAQGLPPLQGTVAIPIQAFFNQSTGIGGLTVGEAPNQYVVDEYNRLAVLAGA